MYNTALRRDSVYYVLELSQVYSRYFHHIVYKQQLEQEIHVRITTERPKRKK
jgi:hypothetical protein